MNCAPTMKRLHAAGIRVSLFIDPAPEQVDAAVKLEADMVELHTGALANAFTEKVEHQELERLRDAAMRASNFGLQVNAGHGINYRNIALIHQDPASRGVEHRPFDHGSRDLRRNRNGGARNARAMQNYRGMSIIGIGIDLVDCARIRAFDRAFRRSFSQARLHRRRDRLFPVDEISRAPFRGAFRSQGSALQGVRHGYWKVDGLARSRRAKEGERRTVRRPERRRGEDGRERAASPRSGSASATPKRAGWRR